MRSYEDFQTGEIIRHPLHIDKVRGDAQMLKKNLFHRHSKPAWKGIRYLLERLFIAYGLIAERLEDRLQPESEIVETLEVFFAPPPAAECKDNEQK